MTFKRDSLNERARRALFVVNRKLRGAFVNLTKKYPRNVKFMPSFANCSNTTYAFLYNYARRVN
jgi:hypothetical protein